MIRWSSAYEATRMVEVIANRACHVGHFARDVGVNEIDTGHRLCVTRRVNLMAEVLGDCIT